MSLKNTLQQELVTALKQKDEIRLSVFRLLTSAIKNEEIKQKKRGAGLADKEIYAIIARQIKQRRDSIEQFTKGGRTDLAEKEQKELNVLQTFLPEQMSEEEIRSIAREVVGSGATGFGAVMGAVMQKVKGRADGGLVKKIVQEMLKNS